MLLQDSNASVYPALVLLDLQMQGKDGLSVLREVRAFDVYVGAPIPEGFKSLTFALRFQAADRTLTDAEVEAAMARLRTAAERELGAKPRE